MADTLCVTITLPDGTEAWWERIADDATVDKLTDAIEQVLGEADGIRT